ncbi:MAG: hypothetical protein KC547_15370 [Anaerolineae bacterium]|nr:hypothetical protein [Anaerolineae bacterium]
MWQESSGREVVDEFGYQAQDFVLCGNRQGLKQLYTTLTARACIRDEQATSDMRRALHEELSRISSRVKRDIFADL